MKIIYKTEPVMLHITENHPISLEPTLCLNFVVPFYDFNSHLPIRNLNFNRLAIIHIIHVELEGGARALMCQMRFPRANIYCFYITAIAVRLTKQSIMNDYQQLRKYDIRNKI